MNRILPYLWKRQSLLLLVFPLFYFSIASYFRILLHNPSLRSVDPEYIYFISGLGIAEGHLKIGHIDNPGTPLQYLIALVFRIVYLFRPDSSGVFAEDVFQHPDLYLSVVNMVISFLVAMAMFFAGKAVFKFTNSVLYGLTIQTLPFLPAIWYDLIGRITPELLYPLPMFALSVFLIGIFVRKKELKTFRDYLPLVLILAFGLSIKLTFISFWIIPLILVKTWKHKLIFTGASIVAFLVIALPVTLQFNVFLQWIKNLFLHSGTYGTGNTNIVDFKLFKTNLAELVHLEKGFMIICVLSAVISGILYFIQKKQDKEQLFSILLSVFAAIFIQFILTGKHFAHRYFIPALMLMPLMVVLVSELIKSVAQSRQTGYLISFMLCIVLIWNTERQFTPLKIKSEAIGNQIDARLKTWHVISSLDEKSIKIIVSQDYGSPFKEYALLYSTAWAANNLKPLYAEKLKKLYPNVYQYTTWDDKFRYWTESFVPDRIFTEQIPVFVYLEKDTGELLSRTLAKINPENKYQIAAEKIFVNPVNNESVFKFIYSKKE